MLYGDADLDYLSAVIYSLDSNDELPMISDINEPCHHLTVEKQWQLELCLMQNDKEMV